MPTYCCVLGCRSKAKKQDISFFQFPKDKDILPLWISFVGRTNWQPTATSRICSLHFNSNDYYRTPKNRLFLKSGVFPKKYVILCDDKENEDPFKILSDNFYQCGSTIGNKRTSEEILESERSKIQATWTKSCNEIEILRKQLQDERELHQQELNKQAEVFSKIMENEKSKLISKVRSGQQKLHILQRNVQRKEQHIKNMKHLFNELKKKFENDTDALHLISQEFEGMELSLFENQIKNNARSASGRRYSDEVKRFAVTLRYYSPQAYEYCRFVLFSSLLYFFHFFACACCLIYGLYSYIINTSIMKQ